MYYITYYTNILHVIYCISYTNIIIMFHQPAVRGKWDSVCEVAL